MNILEILDKQTKTGNSYKIVKTNGGDFLVFDKEVAARITLGEHDLQTEKKTWKDGKERAVISGIRINGVLHSGAKKDGNFPRAKTAYQDADHLGLAFTAATELAKMGQLHSAIVDDLCAVAEAIFLRMKDLERR